MFYTSSPLSKNLLVLLGLFICIISCKNDPNKQIEQGEVKENTYYNKEIGWTMEIPDGWEVMQKDVVQENSDKGLDAISETAGGEIDVSGLKQLLNLKKDRLHIFLSSIEKYELEYEGEWEENNAVLKEILYNTYANKGIKTDTSSSKANVSGLEFDVFNIKLYGPDDKVLLYQDLYSKYMKGFNFGVTLNYLNPKEKNEILRAWKSSKFE